MRRHGLKKGLSLLLVLCMILSLLPMTALAEEISEPSAAVEEQSPASGDTTAVDTGEDQQDEAGTGETSEAGTGETGEAGTGEESKSTIDKITDILGDFLGTISGEKSEEEAAQDEANAKDAIKLVVNNWGEQGDQEFASIELFADGHFLITTPKAGKLPKRAANATRSANIFKRHGDAPLKTRATDINGSIDLENGAYIYGTFTRVKEGVYSLSNNTMIEIKDKHVSGSTTIIYTNRYGVKIVVDVTVDFDYKPKPVVRQLCRSWRMDSSELWFTTEDTYIAYAKQWLKLGRVMQEVTITPEGRAMGFDEDDVAEDKDDYCLRLVFSPCGTYLCFYKDGEVEVGFWEWKDLQNGVMRLWEPFDIDDDDDDDDVDEYMDVTVRFDGKKMRIYHDFMDEENDVMFRAYGVSTFSARY